jgi:hypothetical protein
MKVYVASSWRNKYHAEVVSVLQAVGHDVYDFKNPKQGKTGFHWSDVDPKWEGWIPDLFVKSLEHPIAQKGFQSDKQALVDCEVCVLVLPSGKSSHLEAGWVAGMGKLVVVYMPEQQEPELMYLLADKVVTSMGDIIRALAAWEKL